MKIYVAGSSKEMARAKRWMTAIRDHGGEITEDWVAAIEAAGTANDGLTHEARRKYSTGDLDGVTDADIFWLLYPEVSVSFGAAFEAGWAFGAHAETGKPTVIASGTTDRSIFLAHFVEFKTDEEAFAWISRSL